MVDLLLEHRVYLFDFFESRALVEHLAKVNPIHLSCNEKLAFWINLYNALIMHVGCNIFYHTCSLQKISKALQTPQKALPKLVKLL